jgi:hypothetical protein
MRTSAKPERAANGTLTHHELLSSATEAPLHGPVRSSRQSQRNG